MIGHRKIGVSEVVRIHIIVFWFMMSYTLVSPLSQHCSVLAVLYASNVLQYTQNHYFKRPQSLVVPVVLLMMSTKVTHRLVTLLI